MSNGGNPSGKSRPAWMGGEQGEESRNGAVTTAPPEENAAPEHHEEQEPEQTQPQDPASEPYSDDSGQGSAMTEDEGPYPHEDHDAQVRGGDLSAHPSGKKTSEKESPPESAYPRGSSGAPASIKAAISSFVQRLSSKRPSTPGGKETTETARTESPEQVERELKRSLRETTINGFCRLAIGSHKGGVGKSSMAYGVAGAISYGTNLRVCLVDCDPNVGATRYMVPRPVENSVLDLAENADQLSRLADLRAYVSQNERMGLDILLNPLEAAQISNVEDLADAYERVDSVLQQFYDLVIFDLGQGFRDPAIRRLLELSDELVLVSDSEKIPNAQLPDALNYVEGLGVELSRTTLCINHGRCRSEESEDTTVLRDKHASRLRRITEVEYDPEFSQLLNDRSFHPSQLALETRLGVLTTAGAALEGLRRDAATRAYEKVISLGSATTDKEGDN